jgi:hypothetical protein
LTTGDKTMIKPSHSLSFYLLITVLTIPTVVGCSKLRASVDSTIFPCIQKGNNWETIAQKGNKVSHSALLTWNTTEFGDKFTPEERCQIVSDKLTQAVINNGGRLGNLTLTYGPVNDLTVICVVPEKEVICNEKNMLFTLNQKNAQNPSQVLADITDFTQGEDKTIAEGGLPQYILLENLVDKHFKNNTVW